MCASLTTYRKLHMNIREWLDATNAHRPRLPTEEKARRRAVRVRVLAAAGTTYGTVTNALFRKRIGSALLDRLVAATAHEAEKITVADEWPETVKQAA